MFYSYRQSPIFVNGKQIFATEASLSCQNSLATTFQADERHSFSYVPGGPLQGSFKFSYYLTGNDPVKDLILEEDTPTSGTFGGITFTGGYLKSYTLNASPNNPAIVGAEISFFDQPLGTFSPTSYTASNVPVLRFSDARFSGITGDTTNIPSSNVAAFSYNYNSDLQPVYRQQDITPYRISFKEKTITSEVVCDNLDQTITISGLAANFKLTLNNTSDSTNFETYQINGSVTQKTISVGIDQPVRQSIGIRQNFTDLPPTLTVFYPLSGYPATSTEEGEGIIIYGENLDNVIDVQFGGVPGNITQSENNGTAITTRIPYDAVSSQLKVTTYGGVVYTTGTFLVNDPGISVYSLNPTYGSVGTTVDVSGLGFYRISDVTFGGSGAAFTRINDTYIQAIVPDYATYDYVRVISEQRQKTGVSPYKFVPTPDIDTYSPVRGITGTVVTLVGQGFSGVTGIKFNNLDASSYYITNNSVMSGVVPSGNVLGYIRVYGYSGVTARTDNYFYPNIEIDALLPNSLYTGYKLVISGDNFIPEVMYPMNNNNFLVRFPTTTGSFFRVNDHLLSGVVPSGTVSGPVQIYNNQGAAYDSYQNLTVRYPAPIIQSFSPASGRTGDTLFLYGQNFYSMTGVNLKAAIAAGTVYQSLSFSSNMAGTTCSVLTPNTPTGYYTIRAENAEGTGLSPTNYLVNTPYSFPTQSIGFSGINSGLTNKLSFGHYSSAPDTKNDYISNSSSFDVSLVFPSVSEFNWGAGLGQPRTVLAAAGGNQNVSLYVPTTLRFGAFTGTWSSPAGVTGSFIASVF